MEKKIKEVQDYFKNKLLNKDFKITNIEEHTLNLIIDEKYKFTVWIGNWNIISCTQLYEKDNFIEIELNLKEKGKLHSILNKDVKNFKEKTLRSEKLKQFNKLKKELELL